MSGTASMLELTRDLGKTAEQDVLDPGGPDRAERAAIQIHPAGLAAGAVEHRRRHPASHRLHRQRFLSALWYCLQNQIL